MLDPGEAAAVAERFGVADVQVRRDHLLSHLLAVLSSRLSEAVVFFGGTALARTHLPGGRLSDDLDLYAVPSRSAVVTELEQALVTGVRREYGRLTWQPPRSATSTRRCYAPPTGSLCGYSYWTRRIDRPGRPNAARSSSATPTRHQPI